MRPFALSSMIRFGRLVGWARVREALKTRIYGGGDFVRFAVDLTAWQPAGAAGQAIEIRRGLAELARVRAGLPAPAQFYLDRLSGARRPYLGLWNGSLGHISWVLTHEDWTRLVRLRPGEVELDGAYTFPTHRGRGLLSAVERAILNDVKAEGARVAYTHVAVDNPSSLHGVRKTGFRPIGIVKLRWFLGVPWMRYAPLRTTDADELAGAPAK